MGYEAGLAKDSDHSSMLDNQEEITKWRRTFCFAVAFAVPSMVLMMYFMLTHNHEVLVPGLSYENLILFILATPVQVRYVIFHGMFHYHSDRRDITQ